MRYPTKKQSFSLEKDYFFCRAPQMRMANFEWECCWRFPFQRQRLLYSHNYKPFLQSNFEDHFFFQGHCSQELSSYLWFVFKKGLYRRVFATLYLLKMGQNQKHFICLIFSPLYPSHLFSLTCTFPYFCKWNHWRFRMPCR